MRSGKPSEIPTEAWQKLSQCDTNGKHTLFIKVRDYVPPLWHWAKKGVISQMLKCLENMFHHKCSITKYRTPKNKWRRGGI